MIWANYEEFGEDLALDLHLLRGWVGVLAEAAFFVPLWLYGISGLDCLLQQGTICYFSLSLGWYCLCRSWYDLVGDCILLVAVNAISGLVTDLRFVGYLRVGVLVSYNSQYPIIDHFLWVNLMSVPSPTSPLSFSSSSDSSVDIQDGFPSTSYPSQSGVPFVLDGCRSDHLSRSPHR